MKKKLLKTLSLLLAAAILTSMIAVPASASTTGLVTKSDSINSALYFWGGMSNTYNFTYADGTSATANLGGMCTHYVDGKVAYCIEPQTSSSHNTSYTGTVVDSSTYWTKKLTAAQRHAISLILLYGAPNHLHSTDTYTEFGYEGATQILIWEIIMGLRSATAPYTRSDSRLYNTFKGNRTFPSLDTAYAEIITLMQNHLTIPSFSARTTAKAPAITLDYNSSTQQCSATVTDSNGVLASDYNFTATGVTMTKNGNKLTISAPLSVLQSGTVMASATGRSLDDGNMGAMIWTCPGKQSLITTVDTTNDPVKAYFTLKAGVIPGTTAITKTSDDGDVGGYCFKLYKWGDNLSWYGKSETDGRVYVTNSGYTQSGSTRTYSFTGMTDGTYTFLEALSQKGAGNVFPDSWRIRINYGGIIVYDHTFTGDDLTKDANGDCRLNEVRLSGLTDGGGMEMTIHNAPLTGELEIVKQADDGNVSGISFTVHDTDGNLICQDETDASGHLIVPDLKIGKTYTVTEIEPEGYYSDNPEQTVTIHSGTNTLTFVNHPIPTLKIVKTSETGTVQGFSFTVYDVNGESVTSGETNERGVFELQDNRLKVNTTYTITEAEKEGYVCTANARTITLHEGVNEVSFYNRLVRGSIKITKVDEDTEKPLAGAGFRIYDSKGRPVIEKQTDEYGVVQFDDLPYGDYTYREFKAPDGYLLDTTSYRFSIEDDGVVLSYKATNKLRPGSIKVQKIDQDGKALAGVSFLLEYSLDGKKWEPVNARSSDDEITVGGCTSPDLDGGILVTDKDGIAEFTGLRINTAEQVIRYRLTETATVEGYSLLADYAFEGELTEKTETDVTLSVVNTPVYTMPATGGKGFLGLIFSMALLGVALFMTCCKRKED